jgi:indolepyruvate ferredoxin oxidoreductase, alpha subunit
MKELLSGNEAIARGAFESNVWVAAGYPGTPSSEIIETISAKYPDIDSEWSVNEKVAVEVALGSSIAGVRSLATMKHVGLNVAADPLMTAAYTGIKAGLVIVAADDPGMHSSQNEQDSRNYAKFAKVPMFEPKDSAEAKEFVRIALEVSEDFDTPSILRSVTRVSHTKTVVDCAEPARKSPVYLYQKNTAKYVMVPANAIPRHRVVLERYQKLIDFSNKFEYNTVEYNSKEIGIITHGMVYNYVKEAVPDASILKVAMYPLPMEKIRKFATQVKTLYIIEELDPIIEEEVCAAGIIATGKTIFPEYGELFPEIIRKAMKIEDCHEIKQMALPPRPPVLCKGCGHIPVFEVLRDMNIAVLGDIGCYTLGALAPYNAMDTTICMGASVGNEIGFKKAGMLFGINTPSVGVIGDSTFFHSGMTSLLDAVYNKVPITLIILDNHITAMTGHQPNPVTGLDSKYQQSGDIDIEGLVRGLGVKRVRKANAYKKDELKKAIQEEMAAREPSVILVDEICVIGENMLKKVSR